MPFPPSYDPADFSSRGRNLFSPPGGRVHSSIAGHNEVDFYDRMMVRARANESKYRKLANHDFANNPALRARATQARLAADRSFAVGEKGLSGALARKFGQSGVVMRTTPTSARVTSKLAPTAIRVAAAVGRGVTRTMPVFVARMAAAAGSLVAATAGWAVPVLAVVGAVVAAAGAAYAIYDATAGLIAAAHPIPPDGEGNSSETPQSEPDTIIPEVVGGDYNYPKIPSLVDPNVYDFLSRFKFKNLKTKPKLAWFAHAESLLNL